MNSKESTTAYTVYTAYTTVLVDSKDHRHIVIGLDTINLIGSKCYLLVFIYYYRFIATAITSE